MHEAQNYLTWYGGAHLQSQHLASEGKKDQMFKVTLYNTVNSKIAIEQINPFFNFVHSSGFSGPYVCLQPLH